MCSNILIDLLCRLISESVEKRIENLKLDRSAAEAAATNGAAGDAITGISSSKSSSVDSINDDRVTNSQSATTEASVSDGVSHEIGLLELERVSGLMTCAYEYYIS